MCQNAVATGVRDHTYSLFLKNGNLNTAFLPATVIGSVLTILILWFTSIPLGIPGEWTWDRTLVEPDLFWNLFGGTVAGAIFILFVRQAWTRFEDFTGRTSERWEILAWLSGLAVFSFAWLWVVQEISPVQSRLGKAPFVLYYASSSGYFTRARFDQPDPSRLLKGYEDLMREGDVLHTGTHPPGLFLVFHGLISICESSPGLSAFLDETQPYSFREALDIIATNALRRQVPRPLQPLDRRVLWLATLCVMASASLAVFPLYGLIRLSVPAQVAWVGAALWPAVPAVAIFIPKSDVAFSLIGLCILWFWISAWENGSILRAALAGLATWAGLLCSLAFLPVVLLAAALTFVSIVPSRTTSIGIHAGARMPGLGWRRGICLLAASVAFILPIALLWHFEGINLLTVWRLNYRNHAGFYQQFPRTYWKWLLINPMELAYAAGWPVACLAAWGCFRILRSGAGGSPAERKQWATCFCVVSVWGLLWLTGKNSGEAARLWIVFLPWLVWLASFQIHYFGMQSTGEKCEYSLRDRQVLLLLALQFTVCLLTVCHVTGFHNEWGNAG